MTYSELFCDMLLISQMKRPIAMNGNGIPPKIKMQIDGIRAIISRESTDKRTDRRTDRRTLPSALSPSLRGR